MILSHQHRFILFKVAKTAGTSLEIALSRFCGPNDVITPISPEDEKIRARLGFRGPQNFVLPPIHAGGRQRKFFNHISAVGVKRLIDPWVWDHYYKFCFVRNPWDRVISQYWWRYRGRDNGPSLSEFIASKKARGLNRNSLRFYTIDGTIVVDDIYRYEDLPGALDRIQDKLALPDRLVPTPRHASGRTGTRTGKSSAKATLRRSRGCPPRRSDCMATLFSMYARRGRRDG